ncbi:MAG: threonylcarbamoyl-AMP synthase [Magnetococcales bacterium]|nr:threonylcarbamoyl-AMP synthase [Magnetococcales bacterium]
MTSGAFPLPPLTPERRHAVERAVAALRRGEIIACPTETLPGLGVDPFQPLAVERLRRLKGRDGDKGFIVLIPEPAALTGLTRPPSSTARRLMERFWPGPLTLVLPAALEAPAWIQGPEGGVAVRWSPAPLVQALLSAWGGPLVSTSANPAGHPPAVSAEEIRRRWSVDQVAEVLTLGENGEDSATSAAPSTVVSLLEEPMRLVREGVIPWSALWDALALPSSSSLSSSSPASR